MRFFAECFPEVKGDYMHTVSIMTKLIPKIRVGVTGLIFDKAILEFPYPC